MKLLLDAHVGPAVAVGLQRVRQIDIVSIRDWQQGIYLNLDDATILRAARAEGWTLVSFDQRTISPMLTEWAERGESHSGVIFVDERTFAQNDVGGLIRALVHLLDALGDVSWENRQEFLRH